MYDEVYEPFTVVWFDELDHSKRCADFLAEVPRHNLLHNLNELNSILHKLVDVCLEKLAAKMDRMLAVVREHREYVLWENQPTPPLDASDDQIRDALSKKIKRNISMGAVEITICLEAATTYCADKLGLRDQRLARVLKQSPQLCSSLALLHDTQEQQRLQALTSEVGYLKYPDVSFADVIIHGRYRIPAKMLVVIGSGDNLRLKFASTRVDVGPFDSPTRRCPAYRSSPTDRYLVLNDTLWRLVVDIYHLSGRFDQPRAD